jgi:hypothetical protein
MRTQRDKNQYCQDRLILLTTSACAALMNLPLKSTPTTSSNTRAISKLDLPTAQPTSSARSFWPAKAPLPTASFT